MVQVQEEDFTGDLAIVGMLAEQCIITITHQHLVTLLVAYGWKRMGSIGTEFAGNE